MPLDVAVAIYCIGYIAPLVGIDVETYQYLLAILVVLLPDIDMLGYVFPRLPFGGHRGFAHYPLFYIPIAAVIFLIWGSVVAFIFALLILWHLIHDTVFLGWGVAWMGPFSAKRIRMFPDRDGHILWNVPLLTWLPEQDDEMHARYGTSHWVKRYYFSWSFIGVLEWGALLSALIFAYLR